jgi:hypothetical protein
MSILRSGLQQTHRSFLYRHRVAAVCLAVALALGTRACPSRPDGVNLAPITSLRLTAGSGFLAGIQRQLGGTAADWSKDGVGYLVFHPPVSESDPDHLIFRDANVYRQEDLALAREIYAEQRRQFTDSDWTLYTEKSDSESKWFISYKGTRFDTNHGMPVWVNAKPEIFIGILKQNVFIVVAYTAYGSAPDYVQTINKDVRWVADLLSRASQ